MKPPLVLHLSTVHRGDDTRMIRKIAATTAERYSTTALVTRVPSINRPDGVQFVEVPFFPQLWKRLLLVHPQVLIRVLRLRPRLVHVHVPECLPVAFLLKFLFGTVVVYDVYENLFRQLPHRTRNNGLLFQTFFGWFDRLARRHAYLILAEAGYRSAYAELAKPHEVIFNFPRLETIPFQLVDPNGPPEFYYLGQLSQSRCLDVLMEAVALLAPEYPALRVHLFGAPGFDLQSWDELYALPGYPAVREHLVFHGPKPAAETFATAHRCRAGLALLRPVGDYPQSYPTKLFEYLALGLPVVTSDFPLYRAVVEPNVCGYCLDATDARAVARVLKRLLDHPDEAVRMGRNGRRAVEQGYHWQGEAAKLFDFYRRIGI
jgi:glycosyltransferase involved in cell wall biosynthesis